MRLLISPQMCMQAARSKIASTRCLEDADIFSSASYRAGNHQKMQLQEGVTLSSAQGSAQNSMNRRAMVRC